ncbi:ribonucleoside-diphosphate reductase beta chain [Paenibacillus jamilae]|nr:ribonucleoside-diphosphate reductase beta chain [Paenibacillus jamilae]
MTLKAVNWNREDDGFTQTFWKQNIEQFWTDDEIPLSDDKMSWVDLMPTEQDVYKRVLGGLTLLDTLQGGVGMPQILEQVEGLQRKAVFGFMGMMEQIHAKSYSSIFTTLATNEEIDEIFEWVEQNKHLQQKAKTIKQYYINIRTKRDFYMAMAASVLLESYLFYSGFFYPLYLAGQGKLTASGEIIDLILRDEAIHGLYTGLIAQEVYESMNKRDKDRVREEVLDLVAELYKNEAEYTDELYAVIGLEEEVKKYVRYNANRALQNLGFDNYFPVEDINPIVQNGISTNTKQHDFFSKKGNGYVRTTNIERMTDADFKFDFNK